MKIILSSPNPSEIAQLKGTLESAGIACFTRNEISSGLSPEIPISESTPELWIQDDQRLVEALEIKKSWKTATLVGGSDWVCPACGETSEPQFSSCWKCGAARKADQTPCWDVPGGLQSSGQITRRQDEEKRVEEVASGIPCVSCGKLIEAGTKYCPFCDYTQPYKLVGS